MIRTKNLYLGYKKNIVINSANISIGDGELIFIDGPSGSGKSTLLKSLYGQLKPRGGILQVNGIDISKGQNAKVKALRRKIGIVFQDYKLIAEYNAIQNIMLPLLINGFSANRAKEQAIKLLKHVRLVGKGQSYPYELSGGEQQRVAIARALSCNPKLILADEPTGNLDDYSASVIWDLLRRAKKYFGATVVVVTHKIPHTINSEFRRFKIDGGAIL